MHGKVKNKSKNAGICALYGAKCINPIVKLLVKYVPMSIRSKQTPSHFFKVLTSLAIKNLSIHSIQYPGSNIPSENSLHHNLKKIDLDQLEKDNHLIFAEQVKPFIKPGKKYSFAIDLTDDPYYGEKSGDYVVGGKRKASTNRFFSYATCYLIDGNRKFTIAVIPKKKKMLMIDFITKFTEIIYELGVKIKVLCADREFYKHAVMEYLQSANIPFIIPVKVQGKQMKELLQVRKSCCLEYVMNPKKKPLNLNIVVCVSYLKGKKDKHGLEIHAFSVGGFTDPKKVSKMYERRFSIESSYRIRNTSKPRTSSKKPQVRYLYTIISFLIQNFWVALQWTYFVKRQRGQKVIDDDKFRFDKFKMISWSYLKELFRIPNNVPTISDIEYG